MSKRILITGIRGFAGKYATAHFAARGYEVFGLANTHSLGEDVNERIRVADLRDLAQVDRIVHDVQPTHVLHLAAISNVTHEDVSEIYETNIVGSRNLLNALAGLETRPQSVLLMSSANVYGNSRRGILSETDDYNPANDYGVSKAAMELMAHNYIDRLNIIIARAFNYTGRGQSKQFLIPKIVDHFRSRLPYIELGNTDVARDFSDVRTVVEYLQRLLETDVAIGKTVNICSGVPSTLQNIIEMCEHISGHNLEVRIDPRLQREQEVKVLTGNPRLLRSLVGTIDLYSIEDTLVWMLSESSDE